jgi:hypothetical protein
MATPLEHKAKALHNERLLEALELTGDDFADWAVTVLFYSALHWMRALAAQEGYQIRSYRRYKEYPGEDEVFQGTGAFSPQAFDWYRHLRDDSRSARYETQPFSASEFRSLQQECFVPFKSFVTSKLRT